MDVLVARAPDELDPYLAGWDGLAVTCGRPLASPGWLLSWWACLAPSRARLHVLVLLDDATVVGVAPWYLRRSRSGLRVLQPLGGPTATGAHPLVRPGRETQLAAALGRHLQGMRPRPDLIVHAGDPVTQGGPLLGSSRRLTEKSGTAPFVALGEATSFDGWLSGRSAHFRAQSRKRLAAAAREGLTFRTASPDGSIAALRTVMALHRARWDSRGGSAFLDAVTERMLVTATERLSPTGRLRIGLLGDGQRVVAGHVMVSAGRTSAYWLAGFDEDRARLAPSFTALLHGVRDCIERGDDLLDLGHGDQHYKRRFADGSVDLEWWTELPRTSRRWYASVCCAPRQAYRLTARSLSPQTKARLLGIRRRLAGRATSGRAATA